MCGISGFITKQELNLISTINSMHVLLNHRGPDDSNVWIDEKGIALAHNRLSVIDLSDAGSQPMHSKCRRYTLVFNGEIYNHNELRRSFKDYGWLGHSDTETIIACISEFGFIKSLSMLKGMFAFALWDNKENKLFLARDRMGEKPLYYGKIKDSFVFGSELSAIKAFPDFKPLIDRGSLALLLRYNSIPAPYSIYKDIQKLSPGCYLSIDFKTLKVSEDVYWSVKNAHNDSLNQPFQGDIKSAINETEKVLEKSIVSQMESDVPLGSFLSGGVDSSIVTALMQKHSKNPIKTFSIGFYDKSFNEAEHARLVANHIGTDHTDMYVSEKDLLDVIPYLPKIYDEPFADSSQIPTYLVSKIAKQKVTVCLTGDAGDELFGGYNRYLFTDGLWNKIDKIPYFLRSPLGNILQTVPIPTWNLLLGPFLGKKYSNIGSKLHKGSNVLSSKGIDELYLKLVSQIDSPEHWIVDGVEHVTPLTKEGGYFSETSSIEKMMLHDMIGYLPTDILTKVDRAGMSASLETRCPFLDTKVIDFALSLPLDYKINKKTGKYVLREALYKHVPKELIDRPKMGFGVPLGDWLRGPLKSWASDLISQSRLENEGYFHPDIVSKKWDEHLSGLHDWHHQLWPVLMFQAWLENEK